MAETTLIHSKLKITSRNKTYLEVPRIINNKAKMYIRREAVENENPLPEAVLQY